MSTAAPLRRRRRAGSRLGVLAVGAMLALGAVPGAVLAQAPSTWEPEITVTPATDLDPSGTTVTVTGSGFDPAANTGTRPPFLGRPSGFYVVYGSFTETWRPSEGAPSSARPVTGQVWVLPAASRATLDPTSSNPELATLAEDGTFSFSIDVAPIADGDGVTGLYSYAGSGAVNPEHELAIPLTFAEPGGTDDDGRDDDGRDDDGTTDGTDDDGTDDGTDDDGTTDGTDDDGTDDGTDDGDPADGGAAVSDGHLDWGVKASFRAYVTGPIAAGTVTTSRGASTTDTGTFRFGATSGTYDPASGEVRASATGAGDLDVATAGTVRFEGHRTGDEALLDLTLSDPTVSIDGEHGMLTLDARSRGLEDPDEVYEEDDVPFAELDLTGVEAAVADDVLTLSEVPATLTEEGARAFAGFYEAGEELDPITLVLALDGAALPDDGTGSDGPGTTPGTPDAAAGQLPRTGSSVPELAALGLLLLAAGTLALRRRPPTRGTAAR